MAHRIPVADIQFISDFAAFCRSKGDKAYDYDTIRDGPCGCALTQFFYSCGLSNDEDQWHERHDLVGRQLLVGTWTFSALADRLEALIVDSPVVSVQA